MEKTAGLGARNYSGADKTSSSWDSPDDMSPDSMRALRESGWRADCE